MTGAQVLVEFQAHWGYLPQPAPLVCIRLSSHSQASFEGLFGVGSGEDDVTRLDAMFEYDGLREMAPPMLTCTVEFGVVEVG
jgi:hypothetical protein